MHSDPGELAAHPLRIGLSLRVDVDTHERGGAPLRRPRAAAAGQETDVYAGAAREADARVAKIIAENSDRSAR